MMRSLGRLLILLAVPTLLAAGVNGVRRNGLAWYVPRDVVYPPPKPVHLQHEVGIDAVQAAIDTGGAIFDARDEEHFKDGHIPTAVNVPSHSIMERLGEVTQNYDIAAPIIVYCGGNECEDSLHVFDALTGVGYQNVKIYMHGWNEWTAKGMPVERGAQ